MGLNSFAVTRGATIFLALGLAVTSTAEASSVTFVNTVGAINPGAEQVTFDEFDILDPVGPGDTAVPGKPVTLSSSSPFQVFSVATGPLMGSQVPGLFEGNIIAQPTGSASSGSFNATFSTPVMQAGLGLLNNLVGSPRVYNLRAFDQFGTKIGEELAISVGASAEFLGFTSTSANIALLELNFGPTFGTGQRPLIDSITYSAGSTMAPIPVPAGLPLLLAGLGALAFLRRKATPVGS